jgi:hypothetical protein
MTVIVAIEVTEVKTVTEETTAGMTGALIGTGTIEIVKTTGTDVDMMMTVDISVVTLLKTPETTADAGSKENGLLMSADLQPLLASFLSHREDEKPRAGM